MYYCLFLFCSASCCPSFASYFPRGIMPLGVLSDFRGWQARHGRGAPRHVRQQDGDASQVRGTRSVLWSSKTFCMFYISIFESLCPSLSRRTRTVSRGKKRFCFVFVFFFFFSHHFFFGGNGVFTVPPLRQGVQG